MIAHDSMHVLNDDKQEWNLLKLNEVVLLQLRLFIHQVQIFRDLYMKKIC